MDIFLFIRISIEYVAKSHVSANLAEVTRVTCVPKENTSTDMIQKLQMR